MTHSTKLVYYLVFLFLIAVCYGQRNVHSCIHDHIDIEPEVLPVLEEEDFEGRVLQTYQNIRILLDFSSKSLSTTF